MDAAISEARERVTKAWREAVAAKVAASAAQAELTRLRIVDLADRCPSLKSVTLTCYSEYDDEGSYYDVVSVRGTYEAENGGEDDGATDVDDELYEIGMDLDKGAGALLCDGLWEEAVPIEKLRRRGAI